MRQHSELTKKVCYSIITHIKIRVFEITGIKNH